jgi:hypothetical protein
MAAVTVDAAAKVAYTGATLEIGWSARSLFAYRTAIQQLAGASSLVFGAASSASAAAQSFTTSSALTLTEVRVVILKTAAPTDNVSLTIQSDSSNKPSGSVLGTATNVYNGANLSTTASWVSFQFATPVSLSASTKYWIVMQRSGAVDASNNYSMRYTTGSVYAGGGYSVLNAGVWGAENSTNDWAFQIIQQTPSALYAVTQDTSLHIWKSTNTGATWTEQDSANAPAVTNATYPFDASDTIAGPQLLTAYMTATNTLAVRLFDMSADTWSASTWGTSPPATVSNERSIRVSCNTNYLASSIGTVFTAFTSSTDDADLTSQRAATTGGAWSAAATLLAATSTEASLVSEMVADKSPGAFQHQFYYDCANDDYSMRSITSFATQGTETDLSATAAADETKHAAASYQIYQDASGVDTIIAAFIDASDTIHERILTLEATSASVTMATENAVSAATTTAGRQLSTARYNGTNYIAVNVSGTGISYYTSTVAGTWSAATSLVSGLTNCTLSRILSIEGTGLAVIYTDNGDTKIDWIAVAGGGSTNHALAGTSAGVGDQSGALSVARKLVGTSDGTGAQTGALSIAIKVAGTSSGIGAQTGSLGIAIKLAATSSGIGDQSGALGVAIKIAGTSDAVGSQTGALSIAIGLAGTSAGVGDQSGALTIAVALTGTSTGTGDQSGSLSVAIALAGVSSGIGDQTGTLTIPIVLTGTITASVQLVPVLSAGISLEPVLSANVTIEQSVTAVLELLP